MTTHVHVPYLVPGLETCLLSINTPPPNPQTRTVLDSKDDILSASRIYLKLQINKKKNDERKKKNYIFPLFVILLILYYFFPWLAFFFFLSHSLHEH